MRTTSGLVVLGGGGGGCGVEVLGPELASDALLRISRLLSGSWSSASWSSGSGSCACDRVADENTDRSAVEVMLVSENERRETQSRSELASSMDGSNENLDPGRAEPRHQTQYSHNSFASIWTDTR